MNTNLRSQKVMKLNFNLGFAVLLGGLVGPALGATAVQNFSQTIPLTASPTGTAPQISTTWNVNQWAGPAVSLTAVQYTLTTELYYRGELVALGSSRAFALRVRSDFEFDLPGSAPTISSLDPVVSLSGTSPATSLLPFSLPASGTASATSTANQLATDLATYLGGGVVAVNVAGNLLSTSPGAGYHNNSGLGPGTPFVFVNNAKVFPVFGLQEFSLVATMVVTYTVPEPATYGAVGVVLALGLTRWHAQRRRRP